MLSIWVLNAGRGDSIVIHHVDEHGPSFAVIDSNRHENTVPALRKLKELNAEHLSFVALTHPHTDHYSGLSLVFDEFRDHIDHFYSYPIDRQNSERFRQLTKLLQRLHQSTDGQEAKKRVYEFLQILAEGKKIGLDNWYEVSGLNSQIFPTGFRDVEFWVTLPPPRVKGDYFRWLDSGDVRLFDQNPNLNDLSLAFIIKYKGVEIMLGGDGTLRNWRDQKASWKRSGRVSKSLVCKLPHHGSGTDCAPEVLDHIYTDVGDKVAVISANGRSHPPSETYSALDDRRIRPYCTNLATDCGANVHTMLAVPGIDPILRRYLSSYSEPVGSAITPCQGDVEIRVSDAADCDVIPQFANACPYRAPGLFV